MIAPPPDAAPSRLAVAAALAVLAVLATVPHGAAAADVDPAKVFDARCARCHELPKVRERVERRPAADRAAAIESYLERHYAPDPATRRALAGWLAQGAPRP